MFGKRNTTEMAGSHHRPTSTTMAAPWTVPNKPDSTIGSSLTRRASSSEVESSSIASSIASSECEAWDGVMNGSPLEFPATVLLHSIRSKLFEREEQVARLLEAYGRCMDDGTVALDGTSQREIVLITGQAGSGKSVLARTTLDAAIQATDDPKSFLLYGKCDQVQNSEPLAPFVQALTQFVNDVMAREICPENFSSPDHVVDIVRAAIVKATDESDIEVLTDMIPAFGKILEKRTTKLNLPLSKQSMGDPAATFSGHGMNAPKRTNRTGANVASPGVAIVCKLLQELCANRNFRIILLIDDLQWLDSNSIQMFAAISSIPRYLKNFLLVATCRGDDVDSNHPLPAMLRRLEHPDQGVQLTEIQVASLHEETVANMLAEWLQVENHDDVLPLAKWTYRLSEGNPFFIVEQIRTLVEKRLLIYQDGKWKWEEGEIRRYGLVLEGTEISDFLVQSAIRRASDPTNEVLQIAACLGAEFSFSHVCLVAASPSRRITRAMNVLLAKELIVPSTEAGRFRWAHDKFQKSALSLIPEDDRDEFLYNVGKKLHDKLTEEDLIGNIFLVVNLLCRGIRFFQNEVELEHVAGLCSIAGTLAAQASAFETAASYFRTGIALLPPGHWERDVTYALSQQLYNFSAEMECCLGNAKKVDELAETVISNSRCLQDQLRAYDTQIYSLSSRKEMNTAIRVGLDVLRKLGESVPRRPSLWLNVRELVTTTRLLRRVTSEDVLRLRPMRNWKKSAALQIINLVFPSVLRSQPEYALFLVAKGVKLTMRHGLSPLSSMMFSAFGMMVCHPIGFLQEGSRYEEIGWRIFEKFGANDLRSRIYVMRYAYVMPWRDSARACLPSLVAGASSGMMTGDFEIAFINNFEYSFGCILAGYPLREHYETILRVKQQFVGLGQETVMFHLHCAMQLTENLLGLAKDDKVLSGENFDAQQALDESIAANNSSGVSFISLAQLFLALFTNRYDEAVVIARKLQKSNNDSFGAFEVQYSAFMMCLAEMIVARETKSRSHLRAANRSLRRLKKWTEYASTSWLNRMHLILAEHDALQGRHEQATRYFFSSIEHAERHGWIHEQALALERAGIYLIETSQMDKGLDCLYRSRGLYETWGCVVKCNTITQFISDRISAS